VSLAGEVVKGVLRIAAEFKSVRTALASRVACWDALGLMPAPVEWQGTATSLSDGTWSVSFPAGLFTKAPLVFTQAISPDKTAAATYVAAPWPSTISGCSGHVVTGNIVTTLLINAGANGLKLSGAGITVNVLAKSVR
jgi:hypothetical protein